MNQWHPGQKVDLGVNSQLRCCSRRPQAVLLPRMSIIDGPCRPRGFHDESASTDKNAAKTRSTALHRPRSFPPCPLAPLVVPLRHTPSNSSTYYVPVTFAPLGSHREGHRPLCRWHQNTVQLRSHLPPAPPSQHHYPLPLHQAQDPRPAIRPLCRAEDQLSPPTMRPVGFDTRPRILSPSSASYTPQPLRDRIHRYSG